MVVRRAELRPAWAFRLPRLVGRDGIVRRGAGGAGWQRLLHVDGEPVVVKAAQPGVHRVVLLAEAARDDLAEEGIARARFALGVDDDLSLFHERFRHDPWIGSVVRATPWLRPPRRADPFEALAFAVCEQLIDYPRAATIQRRIVWRIGRRCSRTDLRDFPSAGKLAQQAPAFLQSLDLSAGRAVALISCAREVAAGRVDLHAADHEAGWRRLRRIPGIGSWTIEMLALTGQGRFDVVPAGDLNFLKLAGRLATGGDPYARGTEDEVRELFAPYDPYAGLAATYALRSPTPPPAPRRGGTRWSRPAADPLPA